MHEPSAKGYAFGTFKGVFTPSILTILGVIMYLRSGWVLGHVGLTLTLAIVTLSSLVTFLTGLSVSSLATNMRVKGGGAYYMISRSLGVEAGGAIGIPLFLAQAISIAFYTAGFAESVVAVLPMLDVKATGLVTLAILGVITAVSADLALRTQFVVMAFIALSLLSLFLGGSPDSTALNPPVALPPTLGFWPVLAVFFPAVTGLLAGVSMSGDLKNPSRSLPLGTICAVLTGYSIYMTIPFFLNAVVPDRGILLTDAMIVQKVARWGSLILLGIWSASLSSAVGCMLAAPRTLQALAQDGVLPRFLGRGSGAGNDPRLATLLALAIGAAGILLGDINLIAPVLTMFYLTAYGLLNLSAGFEELMGNPSWRPTFRVPAALSLIGFALCLNMMLMISAGWTLIAAACVAAVYWIMKRRALRARWGDMRMGLLMFGARIVVRRLSQHTGGERNWRPNLLVLAGAPTRRWHLIEMADAISRNRSLVTVASVIPENVWTAERAENLRLSIRGYLEKQGVEAQVRIQPGEDHWSGIRELVRTYGYGPLTPNTVLIGVSEKPDTLLPFARLVRLVAHTRRNLIIVRETADESVSTSRPRIDIWWRGLTPNVAFMLALACLVKRSPYWSGTRLRLCHAVEKEEVRDEAQRTLDAFLVQARVDAEVAVLIQDGRSAFERIRESSSDASLVFLGVRKPEHESDDAYAAYIRTFLDGTSGMPLTVFAMAAETVDFQGIFQSDA
ncbi:MAG TPA: Na-K-Cl cotransporter [Kiritimatiellia bacterium]|nr:Na-K-Cl cotransporter [Kiritimatiellia bacterium]